MGLHEIFEENTGLSRGVRSQASPSAFRLSMTHAKSQVFVRQTSFEAPPRQIVVGSNCLLPCGLHILVYLY
jgi:hypothetical protein